MTDQKEFVFIIKCNENTGQIGPNVLKSYKNRSSESYYMKEGSVDYKLYEERIKEIKESGFIIFAFYNTKETEILELFLGEVQVQKSKNIKLTYTMYRHLTKENNKNAISSILDKIDLDIHADFLEKSYVLLSNMQSLYEDLRERINSVKPSEKILDEMTNDNSYEVYNLSSLAQDDSMSQRVHLGEKIAEGRTQFQRDRERVVNCQTFRRMVDKAQIFSSEKGDHYRTRLTHTLEVNQIAKAISFALNLNLDLTEAIALGHDLGHTPFGHQGERTLDDILSGEIDVGIVWPETEKKRCFGGFKHNYQSVRVLTQLEEKYVDYQGLNVSVQVVEGVLKHTKLKPNEIDLADFLPREYIEKMTITGEELDKPSTLEGQVVALADEIAQRGHDVDDALTSGLLTVEEFFDRLSVKKCVKLKEKLEKVCKSIDDGSRLFVDAPKLKIAKIVSSIVNYFIEDTIENSRKQMEAFSGKGIDMNNREILVCFSPEVEKVNAYLERVVQKKVICNNEVAIADYNASMIIQTLFQKYYENPRLLHTGTIHKIFVETLEHEDRDVSNSAVDLDDGKIKLVNEEIRDMTKEEIGADYKKNVAEKVRFEKRKILIRSIVDYIAGMTDGYALHEYDKLK